MKFAKSACLRLFVSEAGNVVVNLLRKCVRKHTVFEDSSRRTCRTLGTESEIIIVLAVGGTLGGNAVHFFLHYIGRIADTALEKLGVFKSRETNFLKAVTFGSFGSDLFDRVPLVNVSRFNVLRTLWSFCDKLHIKTPFQLFCEIIKAVLVARTRDDL